MTLAHARGELVEKRLVERQAAFLLVASAQGDGDLDPQRDQRPAEQGYRSELTRQG
jgi:hypothetical protein